LLQKNQSGIYRQAEKLMDRETALKAIRENIKNKNLIKQKLVVKALIKQRCFFKI
jgi:hypothetical protein